MSYKKVSNYINKTASNKLDLNELVDFFWDHRDSIGQTIHSQRLEKTIDTGLHEKRMLDAEKYKYIITLKALKKGLNPEDLANPTIPNRDAFIKKNTPQLKKFITQIDAEIKAQKI